MDRPVVSTAELRIADIMSTHLQDIAPEATLDAAVKIMSEQRISCLLVLQDQHPIGILTERDMVRLLHANTSLETPVRNIMTHPVLTVRSNLDFRAAYSLLRRKNVRHLVVTDHDDRVVGITSETDFRNHLGKDVFRKIQNMSATMDRDILSLPPDETLSNALNRMICEKWDYIIVVQHNKPLGIVTERDIPGLLASHANPSEILLRDVMTSPVLTVTTDASVTETISAMTQKHIRHMVVVNPAGNVAGVISQHRVLELLGIEVLEDAWRASEAQYRALVNTVREVIYQTDNDGQWSILNPAWEEITGHAVDASIGERNIHFIHPDDRAHFAERFNALIREEILSFKEEFRFLHENGETRWLEVSARGTRNSEGEMIGTTGALFNITERKAAEIRLVEAAKAEAAANRAKSQFMANMSHELRTPLNGVLGMSEMMLMTPLNAEQHDYATIVRQSAQALMVVINQILEYSNLENDRVEISPEPFSPALLCQMLGDLFAPEVKTKGLALEVQLATDLPKSAFADSSKLRIVLINLLANALKFTSSGSVSISAKPAIMENQTALIFTVSDTGIGMPESVQRNLFAPFYQGDEFINRRFVGTGLGLTICQRHLALLGGTISVTSEEGRGSTFEIMIPYAL